MSDWMPFGKELPRDGAHVIAWAPDGYNQVNDLICESVYRFKRFAADHYGTGRTLNGVTHWMLMPDPPEEAEDD